jgi:hypothetical protein
MLNVPARHALSVYARAFSICLARFTPVAADLKEVETDGNLSGPNLMRLADCLPDTGTKQYIKATINITLVVSLTSQIYLLNYRNSAV